MKNAAIKAVPGILARLVCTGLLSVTIAAPFTKMQAEAKIAGDRRVSCRAISATESFSAFVKGGLDMTAESQGTAVRDVMNVNASVNRICRSSIAATMCRETVIHRDSNIYEDIYRSDNKKYDPYTKRSKDEVSQMLEYAKWWRTQNIHYKTSWTKKGSKYHDNTKSFHYLKPNGNSDCSWFVYNILKKYGYMNHFVSSTKWGEDLSQTPGARVIKGNISKARPGDVICSGKPKLGSAHVAIYVGDGYVIECTFSGVKLTKCSKNPRRIVHFDCNP